MVMVMVCNRRDFLLSVVAPVAAAVRRYDEMSSTRHSKKKGKSGEGENGEKASW